MNNLFDTVTPNVKYELYTPTDMYMGLLTNFHNKFEGDVYSSKVNLKFTGRFIDVVAGVSKIIKDFDDKISLRVDYFNPNCAYIHFDGNTKGLIFVDYIQNEYMKDLSSFEERKIEVEIKVSSSREFVEFYEQRVGSCVEIDNTPVLTWAYISDGRMHQSEIPLESENTVFDEMYPFLNTTLDSYYDAYMKSDAPILLLIGTPGTGKTSFIRELIFRKNLSPLVSYDEKLIASDSFFLNYLTTKENDLLVIEDADKLLYSREDENDAMSKILNISDGLVKLTKKKIIISTNIVDMNKIDSALLRPGRCFDKIEFRKLTRKEAEVIADKAGIELQTDRREYTMAEIFNPDMKDDEGRVVSINSKSSGLGFGFSR